MLRVQGKIRDLVYIENAVTQMLSFFVAAYSKQLEVVILDVSFKHCSLVCEAI